jgi:NADPH-dependent curcumin reductase CurA
LSERPTGEITSTTFKKETRSIEDRNFTNAEQIVVKVTWLSLDPAMRGWLNDSKRSYIAPVKLGEVMRSLGLGIVVRVGAGSKFAVGDLVSGAFGSSFFQFLVFDYAWILTRFHI